MALKEFKLGAAVRVRGKFKDPETGDLFDPQGVEISYRHEANSVTTMVYPTNPEVVKVSFGVYYLDIVANAVGTWHWRVRATGTGQTADEGSFIVPASNFD